MNKDKLMYNTVNYIVIQIIWFWANKTKRTFPFTLGLLFRR